MWVILCYQAMIEAHIEAIAVLGTPCGLDEVYDFGRQDITKTIENIIPVMMKVRLLHYYINNSTFLSKLSHHLITKNPDFHYQRFQLSSVLHINHLIIAIEKMIVLWFVLF